MKEPVHSAMFNVSVTLIPGYPPAIRVSWNFTGSHLASRVNVTYPHFASNNQIDDGIIGSDELGSRIKTFQVSYHPIFSRSVIFSDMLQQLFSFLLF